MTMITLKVIVSRICDDILAGVVDSNNMMLIHGVDTHGILQLQLIHGVDTHGVLQCFRTWAKKR